MRAEVAVGARLVGWNAASTTEKESAGQPCQHHNVDSSNRPEWHAPGACLEPAWNMPGRCTPLAMMPAPEIQKMHQHVAEAQASRLTSHQRDHVHREAHLWQDWEGGQEGGLVWKGRWQRSSLPPARPCSPGSASAAALGGRPGGRLVQQAGPMKGVEGAVAAVVPPTSATMFTRERICGSRSGQLRPGEHRRIAGSIGCSVGESGRVFRPNPPPQRCFLSSATMLAMRILQAGCEQQQRQRHPTPMVNRQKSHPATVPGRPNRSVHAPKPASIQNC
eukprot:366227-Chlamydomonas_euryale.AAC.5